MNEKKQAEGVAWKQNAPGFNPQHHTHKKIVYDQKGEDKKRNLEHKKGRAMKIRKHESIK